MDTNKSFVEIAKKRYEDHGFKVADPFDKKIGRYDVIVSSGVMNGNVEDWLEKRKNAIAHLFEMTNETLAFNMAGALNGIPNTPLIAYANLEEIQAFCATLTPRLIVRNHYAKKGFTIVMFK